MNNTSRLRALLPVSINMAHHIMPHFLLPRLRHIIVNIFRMRFQLVDLLLRDNRLPVLAKSQLHLRLRQRDPQLPPRPEFHIRRKNILHLLTGIPLR